MSTNTYVITGASTFSQSPHPDLRSKKRRGDGMAESSSRSIVVQNGVLFHEHRRLKNNKHDHSPTSQHVDVNWACTSYGASSAGCPSYSTPLAEPDVVAMGERLLNIHNFGRVMVALTPPVQIDTSDAIAALMSDGDKENREPPPSPIDMRVWVGGRPRPTATANLTAGGGQPTRKGMATFYDSGKPTCNNDQCAVVDTTEREAISFLMSGNSLYMTSKRFGVEQSTIRAWLKARKRRGEGPTWKDIRKYATKPAKDDKEPRSRVNVEKQTCSSALDARQPAVARGSKLKGKWDSSAPKILLNVEADEPSSSGKRKRGRPPLLKRAVLTEPILLTPLSHNWHQNINPYVEEEENNCEPSVPTSPISHQSHVDLEQDRISCEWRQVVQEATDSSLEAQQSRLRRDYHIAYNSMLGSGRYGRVYLASSRVEPKEKFAVKVVEKDLISQGEGAPLSAADRAWNRYYCHELKREVVLLRCLRHGALNRLRDFFETPNKIYLVMERMSGGDLLEMLMRQENKCVDDLTTKFYTWQVLCALRFLHQRGIAHYDLKPENVLLAEHNRTAPSPPRVRAVVCDLGHARFVDRRRHRHFFGTTAYAAPEVLAKKDVHTTALDMWGLGVMLCVMLTGRFPFDDSRTMLTEIRRNAPPALFRRDTYWAGKGGQLKNFVSRLLSVEPKKRIDANLGLAHEWLAEDARLKAELLALKRQIAEDASVDVNGDHLLVD